MRKWLESQNGRRLVLLARFIVGGVFIFAAVPKIADPHAFAVAISNYHLVPETFSRGAGAALPVLELLMGLALVTGFHARGAAVLSAGMLIVFAVALTRAMLLDINVDCGCFGSAARAQIGWDSVVRNIGLTGLAALVVLSPDVPWRGLVGAKP
jgi:uncharacterized membrane protein YphA (DoxX/SURF4 family)